MAWHYVLCDLAGVQIGEVLNAYERRWSYQLNALDTASFQLRLDNPMVDEISSRSADVLLKVYQDTTLRFVGECVSAEEQGQQAAQTLACNFAGPLWRLTKRVVGKVGETQAMIDQINAVTGGADPGVDPTTTEAVPQTVSFAGTPRGLIAQALVKYANSDHDTGIRIGSISTLYGTNGGPWGMKPISEAFSELGAARVLPLTVPGTHTVRDSFSTGGAYLTDTAHKLDAPNTESWVAVTGSDFDDFTFGPGPAYAQRTAVADTGGGRGVLAGSTSFSDVIASVDLNWDTFETQQMGLLLRADTSGSKFLAVVVNVYPVGRIQVLQADSGLPVELRSHTFSGALAVNTAYRLLVQVDASGDYAVWFYLPGSEPSTGLRIFDNSSALATGGGLANGQCGMIDYEGANVPIYTRTYDNFGASVPTTALVAQDMNFELVPEEPTADVGQSGVVGSGLKIATLNVSTAIGTVKPDVVVEYGGGNHSAKSYSNLISRDGLANKVYPGVGTDTAPSQDDTSIAARGLFEDVISVDPGDPSLYKALLDANIEVRKNARQIVTYEPSANAPTFGTDFIVGDTLTFRATSHGGVRVNGLLRVYGVELVIDNEGKEVLTPKLVLE